MRLHRGYAALTAVLLAIELGIALFVRDAIVRPYVGDTLAVLLVYAALRAVTRMPVVAAALAALAVAVVIEVSQYFHLLAAIGMAHSPAARMILGSGFDPVDFIAYAAGTLVVLLAEGTYRRASRASAGTRTRNPSSDSSSTI